MNDAQLWAAWQFWMLIAAAIVLVAAALLVMILVTAKRILADAVRALNAAEAIRGNTQPIWQLQTSNEVAAGILSTVQSIEVKGAALVTALEGRVLTER